VVNSDAIRRSSCCEPAATWENLVWGSVFANEIPLFIIAKMGLDIVIRISGRIPRTSITDFKINDVSIGRIDELMPVTHSCSEAGTHAWRKLRRASISDKRWGALKNENKLILTAMGMAQRRHCFWRKACQIDSKILNSKQVAQRLFMATCHPIPEFQRVI
jgi:hypothetical protein